ncbi:glutamine amidotransferase [Stenotrophomonas rhizophila]|uniref:glutamine amidotransferase n=1 Tax=Stenotrophomonas rhizophila TaxID=216778 RepID=UPI0028ABEB73|nr:glutamine amidotransferase [Stenotrophomonas rhizophila]
MKAMAIQHVAFEDTGILAPLLAARGWQLQTLQAGIDRLDDAETADLLIVLGGPISANDVHAYPHLRVLHALLRSRLAAHRPTLGICLGAQLVARALGACVTPMGAKEIGFAPLSLTDAGLASPLRALVGIPVLHWHGESFTLPDGALRLAATPACAQQAFAIGHHLLALQCHPEVDATRIDTWLIGHADELQRAGIDPRALREQAARYAAPLAAAARDLFAAWLDALPPPTPLAAAPIATAVPA